MQKIELYSMAELVEFASKAAAIGLAYNARQNQDGSYTIIVTGC